MRSITPGAALPICTIWCGWIMQSRPRAARLLCATGRARQTEAAANKVRVVFMVLFQQDSNR